MKSNSSWRVSLVEAESFRDPDLKDPDPKPLSVPVPAKGTEKMRWNCLRTSLETNMFVISLLLHTLGIIVVILYLRESYSTVLPSCQSEVGELDHDHDWGNVCGMFMYLHSLAGWFAVIQLLVGIWYGINIFRYSRNADNLTELQKTSTYSTWAARQFVWALLYCSPIILLAIFASPSASPGQVKTSSIPLMTQVLTAWSGLLFFYSLGIYLRMLQARIEALNNSQDTELGNNNKAEVRLAYFDILYTLTGTIDKSGQVKKGMAGEVKSDSSQQIEPIKFYKTVRFICCTSVAMELTTLIFACVFISDSRTTHEFCIRAGNLANPYNNWNRTCDKFASLHQFAGGVFIFIAMVNIFKDLLAVSFSIYAERIDQHHPENQQQRARPLTRLTYCRITNWVVFGIVASWIAMFANGVLPWTPFDVGSFTPASATGMRPILYIFAGWIMIEVIYSFIAHWILSVAAKKIVAITKDSEGKDFEPVEHNDEDITKVI